MQKIVFFMMINFLGCLTLSATNFTNSSDTFRESRIQLETTSDQVAFMISALHEPIDENEQAQETPREQSQLRSLDDLVKKIAGETKEDHKKYVEKILNDFITNPDYAHFLNESFNPQMGRSTAVSIASDEDTKSILGKIISMKLSKKSDDNELLKIANVAPVLPWDGIINFKKNFVSAADILSVLFLVTSRLCYVGAGYGIFDYSFGVHTLSETTRLSLVMFGVIAGTVFEGINRISQGIKLRDELHLVSYKKKKEENAKRLENQHFYSEPEIRDFLVRNNTFISLPGKTSFKFRTFLFNSMCCLENVLGMAIALSAGVSASFVTSGITTADLFGLTNQTDYRTYTLFFGITTLMLSTLDYYRLHLKIQCERWIKNYEMLYHFFVYVCNIPKHELMNEIREVPETFISTYTTDEISQAQQGVASMANN